MSERVPPEGADRFLVVVVGRPHICKHQSLAVAAQAVLQKTSQLRVPEISSLDHDPRTNFDPGSNLEADPDL